MKLKKLGRFGLALAASAGIILGAASCTQSFTVGYLYVTGQQYNQIAAYKIDNNTGALSAIHGSPFAAKGVNPIQAAITANGRFMYVLSNGCGNANQLPCPGSANTSSSPSSIDLYSIGGSGVLTFQQSYSSKGQNTVSMALNSGGSVLYALDQLAPDNSGQGDITAFGVDGSTGRLSLITNQQVTDPNTGTGLQYFKVGTNPTWFSFSGSGTFLYTIDQGPGATASVADPNQAVVIYAVNPSGQLTTTQNAPTPTGATRLTFIAPGRGGATAANMFLLDAGAPGSNGLILPYTVGTGGNLGSVTGGAVPNNAQGGQAVGPQFVTTDSTGKFVYVANSGPNNGTASPASVITGYLVNTGTQLSPVGSSVPFGTGSGPRCIVEDPSVQYLYTANFNDSTIVGKVIDKNAGVLNPLRRNPSIVGPGNPTWCVVSGTTF